MASRVVSERKQTKLFSRQLFFYTIDLSAKARPAARADLQQSL